MSAAPPLDPQNLLPLVASGQVRVLRQSLIGSLDICLKRGGYDLDPARPRGTGEARIVGTSYHAGLEAYYADRMDGVVCHLDKVTAAARLCFDLEVEEHRFWAWEVSGEDAWTRVVKMLTTYFATGHQWGPHYRVLGVEQEWYARLTDDWVAKGTIDLVLEGPEGVVLDDHKTTGKRWQANKEAPRKNAQAVLYPWAWWTLTGVKPVASTFSVMNYRGDFDRRWAYPTPAHMGALLEKAGSLTRMLDKCGIHDLPANPSSVLCSPKYCDHWQVCPFGAAAA